MSHAGRVTMSVAAVLAVALGAWATVVPVVAQARGTVHLSIQAGERQGELDIADPFCSAGYDGANSWRVSTAQTPEVAQFTLSVGSVFDTVLILLGNYDYQLYAEEADITDVRIDDRGSSATLTVQTAMTSPDGPEPIPVRIVAECTVLDRSADMPWPSGVASPAPPTAAPTEAIPTLTPVQLGTPAPGSTTFRLVVDSGPDVGDLEVWTLQDACQRLGDTGWAAQYANATTAPSTIGVLLLADAASTAGIVSFSFGAGPDARTYTATSPVITLEDRGPSANIRATGEARAPGDASGSAEAITVAFDLTIGCAQVGS